MSNKELKPCPFCNGEAELYLGDEWFVECQYCLATTSHYPDKADAILYWNERNYPEKQDSSNYSEIPNSSKELMEFVKFCRNASATDIRQIHDQARDLIANYKECCEQSCKKEKATCKKSLQVSRSDIERTVKRKVFNTRNADTLKKMFIIAEINNSFKVYCGALCIGESFTIEEAKGIVEVFLVDFICSALGVEVER